MTELELSRAFKVDLDETTKDFDIAKRTVLSFMRGR
jgi:hypothetical protein